MDRRWTEKQDDAVSRQDDQDVQDECRGWISGMPK
jgi:hypothetical protein